MRSDAKLFGWPELYEDRIADALKLVPAEAGIPVIGGAAEGPIGTPQVREGHPA